MGNKYIIVVSVFVVWMLFFDSNNIFQLYRRSSTLRDLHKQAEFYDKEIKDLHEQKSALTNDPELMEKFAREEYLMKKPDEDIFIIVEE